MPPDPTPPLATPVYEFNRFGGGGGGGRFFIVDGRSGELEMARAVNGDIPVSALSLRGGNAGFADCGDCA